MTWDLSRPDWEQRLLRGQSLLPDLPHLDWEEANRGVAIFNNLRLFDVENTPPMSEAGGDWFREIVAALCGSYDRAARRRFIREIMLLVPKKNGKTSYGALLMLTMLLMNAVPSARFILTAPVQETADLALATAIGAIELDDVLKKKLWVREHEATIVHRVTQARLEILTFNPKILTGPKVHGALIDELHLLSTIGGAESSLRQIRGGMLPFAHAFLIFITTQSQEQPAGVFRRELVRARGIRNGTIRTGVPMLPVLYELPERIQRDQSQAGWRNPKMWPLVNPNLGRGFQLETLEELRDTAEQDGMAELRAWASQHVNIEVGLALAAAGWAGQDHWEKCGHSYVTLDYLLTHSEVITIGIDGGGLDDLLGLAVVGREIDTGRWLVWAHAWCVHNFDTDEGVLKRRQDIAARLLDFQEAGDLTIVPRPGQDIKELAGYVKQCEATGLLGDLGVDTVGLGSIVDAVLAVGIDFERLRGIPQGYKLMGYIQTVERKLAAEEIAHGARPMMAWCVGNAKPEPRGNATMITKQTAGTAKIDPLMALFNAAALMSMNPTPKKKQYQLFFAGD